MPSGTDDSDSAPLQRIRSLADFQLYLSPSRLAHHGPLPAVQPHELPVHALTLPPNSQRKRTLRPALLDTPHPSPPDRLSSRRSRPPLRLLGVPAHVRPTDQARSYSDLLIQHHAGELGKLDRVPSELLLRGREKTSSPDPSSRMPDAIGTSHHTRPSPHQPRLSEEVNPETISAFSRSSNPYYGYPAVRIPDPSNPNHTSIRPRYQRRRKRDLARTLLFLLLLRLQTFRDQVERALGLNRLLPWTGTSGRYVKARDPTEGLMQTAHPERGKVIKRTSGSDWTWMVICFMLMRGTWTKLLFWPLEVIGLTSVKDMLGLA